MPEAKQKLKFTDDDRWCELMQSETHQRKEERKKTLFIRFEAPRTRGEGPENVNVHFVHKRDVIEFPDVVYPVFTLRGPDRHLRISSIAESCCGKSNDSLAGGKIEANSDAMF